MDALNFGIARNAVFLDPLGIVASARGRPVSPDVGRINPAPRSAGFPASAYGGGPGQIAGGIPGRRWGQMSIVPVVAGGFAVVENRIGNIAPVPAVGTAPGAVPDDFVAKAGAVVFAGSEHSVQQLAQVAVGVGVAVQVQAAGGFQYPVDFHQPDGHKAEVGGAPVAVDQAGGFNEAVDGGVGVFQGVQPFLVDVVFPAPDVPEAAAHVVVRGPFQAPVGGLFRGGDAPARQQAHFVLSFRLGKGRGQVVGDKGILLVEGRVDAGQVDALVVEGAQEVQVVGQIDAAIDGVEAVGLGGCGHRWCSRCSPGFGVIMPAAAGVGAVPALPIISPAGGQLYACRMPNR